ncbi:MAG: putative Ig domain-containing protein, partial [Parahaliea sp.]
MIIRFATLIGRLSAFFAILALVSACGGGGGSSSGGGGFLPDQSSPPLQIATNDLPAVTESPYNTVLEATGGREPYTWTLNDDGGSGLTLSNDGVLSGPAPTRSGSFVLKLGVRDNSGDSVEKTFTLTVDASAVVNITSTGLDGGTQGLSYLGIVTAEGGTKPYTWSVVDHGGTGFQINDEGILRGTAPDGGSYAITLKVIDASQGSATKSFILSVAGGGEQQALTITTDSLEA